MRTTTMSSKQEKWLSAILLLVASLCFLAVPSHAQKSDDDLLNIFVVAHSHDDVGWLMPVDQYYEYEVQYIYDSVITSLLQNPQRTFIPVEIAFFERWWNEQTDLRKNQTRMLVENGQLEFVLGGWCMNDEATTHFAAEINQMTFGHDFIFNTFGVRPKIAWHIDPFGASSMTPVLWNMAGFEGFVINRIDYRLKQEYIANKHMEFIWRGSKSLGNQTDIFTHVMYAHYSTPAGFDWEHGINLDTNNPGPEPVIIKQPSPLTPTNVKQTADAFVSMAKGRAASFLTNNVMIPYGDDFRFQNADMRYKNMDKLIDYINQNSAYYGARVKYSTLSDYFAAVKGTKNVTWPVVTHDFFPYADNNESYWTGYFTSRPTLKTYARESDAKERTAEILYAVTRLANNIPDDIISELRVMRDATSTVQHHDAVTGTEKLVTAEDYVARLDLGGAATESVTTNMLSRIIGAQASFDVQNLWNNLAVGKPTPVVVYNNQPWSRKEYIKITINTPAVKVSNPTTKLVPFQISPIPTEPGNYTLFILAEVPPMGFNTYTIVPGKSSQEHAFAHSQQATKLTIQNENVLVTFDASTNLTSHVWVRNGNDFNYTSEFTQQFVSYAPVEQGQCSGAYIFRPLPENNVSPLTKPMLFINTGDCVEEAYQVYQDSNIVQVFRVYKNLDDLSQVLESQNTIGPIDVSAGHGREIVSRFSMNIANNATFFTDNNGLEMQLRTRNLTGRPGDADAGVALSGNYYPIVSRAFIRDEQAQFTIMSRAAHGGSSLADGQLELMLHRRLLQDDNRGVGEPLNDASVIEKEPLWTLVDQAGPASSAKFRKLNFLLENPLHLAFVPSGAIENIGVPFSALTHALPDNVYILTLSARDNNPNGNVILRLMHIFEAGEHPILSQPVEVDLSQLFAGFEIASLEERTLTVNAPKTNSPNPPQGLKVILNPMEIRSFYVNLKA